MQLLERLRADTCWTNWAMNLMNILMTANNI